MVKAIAIATCITTNQNPNSVWRREAPPHTIWVLSPNKNGDSYNSKSIVNYLEDLSFLKNQTAR
jgi:hypothetical protein